jgi:hypothetical protein
MPRKRYSNFRILGCDPGKVNFAWAIYGDDGLEEHGLIDGAESIDRLEPNAAFFERVVRFTEPDACLLERFHQRPGRGSSKNMELVNLMIGQCIIICKFHKIPCYLITAAEHKRWIAENFAVEKVAKKSSGKVSKKYDITTYAEWLSLPTEHEVDAANLAKYGHDHKLVHLRATDL